jgi:hypothetical protein
MANNKLTLFLCLIKHQIMKTNLGVDVWLHTLLTSALDGSQWSGSYLSHFTFKVTGIGTYCIGSRVGPSVCLEEKSLTPGTNRTMIP